MFRTRITTCLTLAGRGIFVEYFEWLSDEQFERARCACALGSTARMTTAPLGGIESECIVGSHTEEIHSTASALK